MKFRSSTYQATPALAILLLALATLTLGACGDDNPTGPSPAATDTGFKKAYALDHWTKSTITDGTTDMMLDAGTDSLQASFTYDVDLGNPGNGVTPRHATFSVPAMSSGKVTMDWTYTGFHAFFAAYADLEFFAEQGTGVDPVTVAEVDSVKVSGNFTFSGTTTLTVVEGENFGFTIGGENFDSNSRLRGNLHVTRIVTPR